MFSLHNAFMRSSLLAMQVHSRGPAQFSPPLVLSFSILSCISPPPFSIRTRTIFLPRKCAIHQDHHQYMTCWLPRQRENQADPPTGGSEKQLKLVCRAPRSLSMCLAREQDNQRQSRECAHDRGAGEFRDRQDGNGLRTGMETHSSLIQSRYSDDWTRDP